MSAGQHPLSVEPLIPDQAPSWLPAAAAPSVVRGFALDTSQGAAARRQLAAMSDEGVAHRYREVQALGDASTDHHLITRLYQYQRMVWRELRRRQAAGGAS